jgi:hypothetical protein
METEISGIIRNSKLSSISDKNVTTGSNTVHLKFLIRSCLKLGMSFKEISGLSGVSRHSLVCWLNSIDYNREITIQLLKWLKSIKGKEESQDKKEKKNKHGVITLNVRWNKEFNYYPQVDSDMTIGEISEVFVSIQGKKVISTYPDSLVICGNLKTDENGHYGPIRLFCKKERECKCQKSTSGD